MPTCRQWEEEWISMMNKYIFEARIHTTMQRENNERREEENWDIDQQVQGLGFQGFRGQRP
jgi:hypothetical protein